MSIENTAKHRLHVCSERADPSSWLTPPVAAATATPWASTRRTSSSCGRRWSPARTFSPRGSQPTSSSLNKYKISNGLLHGNKKKICFFNSINVQNIGSWTQESQDSGPTCYLHILVDINLEYFTPSHIRQQLVTDFALSKS